MEGCARPMRGGFFPVPSYCSSGTVIQSAMPSKRLTAMPLPWPVMPRAISASSTAAWAFMPQAMSQQETPTRPGPSARPVTLARPVSACTSRS